MAMSGALAWSVKSAGGSNVRRSSRSASIVFSISFSVIYSLLCAARGILLVEPSASTLVSVCDEPGCDGERYLGGSATSDVESHGRVHPRELFIGKSPRSQRDDVRTDVARAAHDPDESSVGFEQRLEGVHNVGGIVIGVDGVHARSEAERSG